MGIMGNFLVSNFSLAAVTGSSQNLLLLALSFFAGR